MLLTKNKDNPLVSVIVPVYNVAKYLERCVQSIREQTYTNLEIILVNDGSTDLSGEICNEFAKKDNRITVFHQTNKGQSEARNTGLNYFSGEYLIFIDSDDWIRPEMVSKLLLFSIENNLHLVECGVLKSRGSEETKQHDSTCFIENQSEAMLRLLTSNNFSVWRRIYSRELIAKRKFIPGKINEDVFFTIDTINRVSNQGFISELLYVYNTENESTTRSAYSLKKLDAKDALYYIGKETENYNIQIRTKAQQYLLRGLINHYNPIFIHSYLDPRFVIRKGLREEIKQQILKMESLKMPTKISRTERIFAMKLPLRIYGGFRILNEFKVQLRLLVLRVFNV